MARHDQDKILLFDRNGRKIIFIRWLRAENQVVFMGGKPIQQFGSNSCVIGKLNLTIRILSQKTRSNPRNIIDSECAQQSETDQSVAFGAPLKRGDTGVQCLQCMFCTIQEFLAEARQCCVSTAFLKERYAEL